MGLKLFLLMAFWGAVAFADSVPVMEQVNLKPGDVVVSINGKKMKNNLMAMKTLGEVKTPSKLVMEVLREGKIQKLSYNVK